MPKPVCLPFLGTHPVDELTSEEVRDGIEEREHTGYACPVSGMVGLTAAASGLAR